MKELTQWRGECTYVHDQCIWLLRSPFSKCFNRIQMVDSELVRSGSMCARYARLQLMLLYALLRRYPDIKQRIKVLAGANQGDRPAAMLIISV
jgi:hypothetical protein